MNFGRTDPRLNCGKLQVSDDFHRAEKSKLPGSGGPADCEMISSSPIPTQIALLTPFRIVTICC